jgi:hypothetical protein
MPEPILRQCTKNVMRNQQEAADEPEGGHSNAG